MDTTIEEPRYRNHPETHPEIVTRLQRTGTLDFTESVRRGIRGDSLNPLFPGSPLAVVREEVVALAELVAYGNLIFTQANVVDCLHSILRTIDRESSRWAS